MVADYALLFAVDNHKAASRSDLTTVARVLDQPVVQRANAAVEAVEAIVRSERLSGVEASQASATEDAGGQTALVSLRSTQAAFQATR